ncbi:MAG: diguanylate cyclase [Lysobacterales bacterium]
MTPDVLPRLAQQHANRRREGARGQLLLVLAGLEPLSSAVTADASDRAALLEAVAERLRNSVRAHDMVIQRADGDFLLALVNCLPEQAALRLSKILAAVGDQPVDMAGRGIDVLLAAGAATLPDSPADDVTAQRAGIDAALARAAAALTAARARGSDRAVLVFDGVESVAGHPLAAGAFTEIPRSA